MIETELHRPTLRVLDILESVSAADEGLTLTEIAAAIGASKSTIFPVIKSLVSRKYVHLNAKSLRYSPGVACLALAGASTERTGWVRLVTEEMQRVVAVCDEVCQLGILDGENVLYIGKVESRKAVRLVSHVGKRLPAAAAALGKAMIHEFSDERIAAMYPDGLPAITPFSITSFAELRRHLDAVRDKGYAVDDRELNEETRCYAVPLRHHGTIVAALSVSLPVFRATGEKTARIIDTLFEAQASIERLFASSDEVDLFDGAVSV
ncbi:MAG: IclR family transcriptional regulator [Telmatospirillum sp.]|nr:IclR family transcriptional regulator [Telmatospirillum sp.]